MLYTNAYRSKAIFVLSILTGIVFSACSQDDSSSSPSQNEDSHQRYSIEVNEQDSLITIHQTVSYNKCVLQDYEVLWLEDYSDFSEGFRYSIRNNYLVMDDSLFFKGDSPKSIYGNWTEAADCQFDNDDNIQCKSAYTDRRMEITRDSLFYFTARPAEYSSKKPEETPINLGESFFMKDIYRCVTKERFCDFGHWHFTKSAAEFNKNIINSESIEINEQSSNSLTFTVNNQKFSVNVEHVQIDSLNNGREYYYSTVQSNTDTCYFEHLKQPITKDLCKRSNLKYFVNLTGSETDDSYDEFNFYFKGNELDFATCVYNLVK